MAEYNLMRQALGEQWSALPKALKSHYQDEDNTDIGTLDIEYPACMQFFLNLLHIIGALLNRRGSDVPATVAKVMQGEVQYWQRTLTFADGKKVYFRSHWYYVSGNRLIEYVNPFVGLCMSVEVRDETLYYSGEYYVLRLGSVTIPIPEWLLLGHTTIVEQGVDDSHFTMDFKLCHPLFGQIYRYSGRFTTVNNNK